jgi:hypothetical protein
MKMAAGCVQKQGGEEGAAPRRPISGSLPSERRAFCGFQGEGSGLGALKTIIKSRQNCDPYASRTIPLLNTRNAIKIEAMKKNPSQPFESRYDE